MDQVSIDGVGGTQAPASSSDATSGPSSAARGPRKSWTRLAGPYAVPAVLVVLIIVFSIAMPSTFLTGTTWRGMAQSQSVLLVLALAVTLPLRNGDFDLSIGAVAALSSSVTAIMATTFGWNPIAAVAVGLLCSLLVGIVNCFGVLIVGIDAFIATLATMTVVTGITFLITHTTVVIGIPDALVSISRTQILGLPSSVYYGWGIAIVLWVVYQYTPYGRFSLFVRGNPHAAKLIGIRVDRVRALAFIWCSILSGVAGVIVLGIVGAGDPGIGSQFLLQPYAAAFLGATAIQLGRFNVVGTIFGLYRIVVGVTGLQLLGASGPISQVFYGTVLFVSVGLAKFAERRAS